MLWRFRVRPGEKPHEVGVLHIRSPDLLPVDGVIVAVPDRPRLQRLREFNIDESAHFLTEGLVLWGKPEVHECPRPEGYYGPNELILVHRQAFAYNSLQTARSRKTGTAT